MLDPPSTFDVGMQGGHNQKISSKIMMHSIPGRTSFYERVSLATDDLIVAVAI